MTAISIYKAITNKTDGKLRASLQHLYPHSPHSALASQTQNIYALNKMAYSSFACGTSFGSLVGAAIGTFGLVSSIKIFTMGRTSFGEKKQELNHEFNRKIVNVAATGNTRSINTMLQFYDLTPDEQKSIRREFANRIPSITIPT